MNPKNPNNCSTCDFYSLKEEDIHCYMFKDPPEQACLKHTERYVAKLEHLSALAHVGHHHLDDGLSWKQTP